MTMVITTARNGQLLREYAKSKQGMERVAIFPEAGHSSEEQAFFLKNNVENYDEIVTFSAYIISDAAPGSLQILDDLNRTNAIRHGDSVNKIGMALWHRFTIGSQAYETLESARNQLPLLRSREEIEALISNIAESLGDSIEKHSFLTAAYKHIDTL